MKLVGIVGSNADLSYNRILLQYIQKHFGDIFDLELLEIKDIPMFNQSNDQTFTAPIQNFSRKIMRADGVIIATPEHNHTIPASLKSVIEWLSYKIHPLDHKPVMIVGASYYDQGTSRAQLHLRQILDSPGVNALVTPGNEFLLAEVKKAFDEKGDLKDQGTVDFLESSLKNFIKFIQVISQLGSNEKPSFPPEDLYATGRIATTIDSVDKYADDWVEQAAKVTHAVEGNTYVHLNRGILTVDQLNYFLDSMPMELTYADSNNQFLYYNYNLPSTKMFAPRVPEQVGNPFAKCHPDRAYKGVEHVIQQLRSGAADTVRIHVPKHADKFVVHNYQAMHDADGNYAGVNEYILDFKPIVEWYLKQTGQQLVGGVDGVSSASVSDQGNTDAVSSASVSGDAAKTDAVSSASVKE